MKYKVRVMRDEVKGKYEAAVSANPRLEVVDALRGFALIAIVLLHSIEHYNLFADITWEPNWLKSLDGYVVTIIWFLLAGKAYATFSLLFGFVRALLVCR